MNKNARRPSGLLVPAHVQLGKPRAVYCKRERHHVYIDELRGLVLGCWCAPRACHGDVLVRLANMSMVERECWLALAA